MSDARARVAAAAGLAWLAMVAAGCKPAVVAPPAPAPPPPVSADTKLAWTIRLEQARTLRDPDVVAAPVDRALPRPSRFASAAAADLGALALDPDASVRARAIVAIGRVDAPEGRPLLVDALADPDATVRADAAFGLGLAGADAKDAVVPLEAALGDASLAVRARAVDALGLIGDTSAIPSIFQAATGCGATIATIAPDDEAWPKTPDVEVCRAALFALVRLKSYDGVAAIALDAQGAPVSQWWPVAFALERLHDPRAIPALTTLAKSDGIDTAGFALRGLAELKDANAVPIAAAIARDPTQDLKLRVAAVRLLGAAGGTSARSPLLDLLDGPTMPRDLAIEVVAALGALHDRTVFDTLADFVADSSPAVRAAALAAAANANPDAFLVLLSGLDRDPDWSVRAALATVLGTLPANRVTPALDAFAADDDARVHGPALAALVHAKAPDATARILAALAAPDFVERATAADLVGETKPDGGVPKLQEAYARAQSDATYVARMAAIEALAKYGGDAAMATIRTALNDGDWPVRVRAAELLHGLGDVAAEPARPAPLRKPAEFFSSPDLLHPRYLPHAFIETTRGTIEVELNVTDAPITTATFIEQAESGFFNGIKIHRIVPAFVVQDGDPRGDGEGGPGYTIPDELSPIPFLRGTMGTALDTRDTAGSQWFITLSPAPHLDGHYTAFGRVVSGEEVLDRLEPWDVITRVRIWDGVSFK